jgi:hypothetical protein
MGESKKHDIIGITNYDAISDDLEIGNVGALVADESSMFKGQSGVWAKIMIKLGRGLDWKLALTGTPAPNDRIEFANHAVFLDAYPTINSFLARFFINRGQTDNRWELKKHALGAFYRALSHWCIFLDNPATYGWKDNCETVPPIQVHVHDVGLTDGQREAVWDTTGTLFVGSAGGITRRSKFSQISKGNHNGVTVNTLKPEFIRTLVKTWPEEQTIIWCHYNHEQESMAKTFPEAANLDGSTSVQEREMMIGEFKNGTRRILISKGKIIGYGVNLQCCTRMVFSGLSDSWESYHQCVKRANRVGSTMPLNVHIPVTELERPFLENVLRKAHRIEQDTIEQEKIFKEQALEVIGGDQ